MNSNAQGAPPPSAAPNPDDTIIALEFDGPLPLKPEPPAAGAPPPGNR